MVVSECALGSQRERFRTTIGSRPHMARGCPQNACKPVEVAVVVVITRLLLALGVQTSSIGIGRD